MNIKTYKNADFTKSTWSGGTTTELYIYPPHASYAKRNFDLRISTAQVECEQSTFTPLANINRLLMILKGKIDIKHKGHHEKTLNELDCDQFSGNWETTSVGRCTDFNVMTQEHIKAELYPLVINKNETVKIKTKSNFACVYLYVVKGTMAAQINDKTYECSPNELLVCSNLDDENIHIYTQAGVTLAIVQSTV